METTHTTSGQTTKRAAVGGLAVVGFIALILIGIATAIYAASYLPKAFSRLSTANVYLSGLNQPNDGNNQLQAVDPNQQNATSSAPTSVPLSPATTTAVYTPAPTTPAPAPAPKPTYTPPVYTPPTYQVVTVPSTPSYYGLADLVTTITSVGYLRVKGDTSTFVSANTVPSGYGGAVRFVVANRGTNTSNPWNFRAQLPTSGNDSDYRSPNQRSLNPGDSIVFTLGFDGTSRGSGTVRIEADSNDNVRESNENNNTATASIYMNGGSTYSSSNTDTYDSNGNYCVAGTSYSNGRYYCNGGISTYDSNGNTCSHGTYYQNGRYYCQTTNSNTSSYDSNGNYCSYGTYTSNGRTYCETSTNTSNGNSSSYDSNGNYCSYGTYYQNGRYYCGDAYTRSNSNASFDSNGNYCSAGNYTVNGRAYCY